MYIIKASLDRRENSIFALNPRDESKSMSIDDSGTPSSGQTICNFGQLA